MIPLKTIEQAKSTLELVVSKTPFTFAPICSQQFCADVYLKTENLQLTGSFKLRGAFNKIATIIKENKNAKIIAASAGNHAQGVAFAAKYFGVNATIVMPEATPLTKISGVKSFGAEVILFGANYDEAYLYATNLANEQNLTFIHPFADDLVIAGQGTIALEMLEMVPDLDFIVVPIGGGGLISGVASAAKQINPSVKIIGVTASGAPAMRESFEAKQPIDSTSVRTIADGIAVRDTNPKMLDLVLELVDKIVEVEDKEIANAILFLLEKQKIVVEGAGAVAMAALMHKKFDFNDKKVGVILSGGNIDVTMLSLIIEKGLVKSARKMNLIVTLIDKPGSLMRLTEIFTSCSANIVQIDYDRHSVKLDFGDANIIISLETKGPEHQEMIKKQLREAGYKFKEL